MATRYSAAPEVAAMGRELVREHHRHLIGTRVDYLFMDTTPKRGGKECWANARKVSSLAAFLAGRQDTEEAEPFFVICVSEPIWQTLSPERRRALVDHELCHCWAEDGEDGNRKLSLLPHDCEEFTAIIGRYGIWRADIETFAEAIEQATQGSLFDADNDSEERPTLKIA